MTPLHPDFRRIPIAHRALHSPKDGPENSLQAVAAAVDRGYGIEVDVQLSSDGRAMVFHDYDLGRMTAHSGPVRQRSADALGGIGLSGGEAGIPTLAEVLEAVGGRVPLLIEIKDQDGALGPAVGPLERALASDLVGYGGPVAVMSFNPYSVAAMAEMAPDVARGLTTCGFRRTNWPVVPERSRKALRGIPDYDRLGASFISHDRTDLGNARVAALKAEGAAILCWTVRSPEQERAARKVADNITFEDFSPEIPAA